MKCNGRGWRNSGYHPVLLVVTTLYGVCRSTLSSSPLINRRCVVGNSDSVQVRSVILNAFRFTSSSIFVTTDTVWSGPHFAERINISHALRKSSGVAALYFCIYVHILWCLYAPASDICWYVIPVSNTISVLSRLLCCLVAAIVWTSQTVLFGHVVGNTLCRQQWWFYRPNTRIVGFESTWGKRVCVCVCVCVCVFFL